MTNQTDFVAYALFGLAGVCQLATAFAAHYFHGKAEAWRQACNRAAAALRAHAQPREARTVVAPAFHAPRWTSLPRPRRAQR